MTRPLTLLLSLALVLAATSPRAAAQSGVDEVLDNATVVSMTKAGLGPSVIVAKIRASRAAFDVSSAELVRMKQQGVTDDVLEAMVEAASPAATGRRAPSTPLRRSRPRQVGSAGDPTRPAPPSVSESGIYYAHGSAPEEELRLLEPSVYTQTKETGAWKAALTYGVAKVRSKIVLQGANAPLQIEERRPSFYFYFDVAHAGLSSSGTAWGPTTSASEFVLARMDVKKSSRELQVGENGQYTGRQRGVSTKAVHPFKYEKLAPGVFRVTPKADLPPGEYCFFFAGSVAAAGGGAGPKLFDFGVSRAAAE